MIRPLRRAHGVWWLALALALPAGLLLALASRPPAALPSPALPSGWSRAAPAPGPSPIPLAPSPFVLATEPDGSLRLHAQGRLLDLPPGLLLYATSDQDATTGGELPADAASLGPATPGARVPAPAGSGTRIVLYSLATGTIVGAGDLPTAQSREQSRER